MASLLSALAPSAAPSPSIVSPLFLRPHPDSRSLSVSSISNNYSYAAFYQFLVFYHLIPKQNTDQIRRYYST